jgi:hypothetical protein
MFIGDTVRQLSGAPDKGTEMKICVDKKNDESEISILIP